VGTVIKEDLRIMKINNWTQCIQDRVKWKEVNEKAKNSKQWNCMAWCRRRYQKLATKPNLQWEFYCI